MHDRSLLATYLFIPLPASPPPHLFFFLQSLKQARWQCGAVVFLPSFYQEFSFVPLTSPFIHTTSLMRFEVH